MNPQPKRPPAAPRSDRPTKDGRRRRGEAQEMLLAALALPGGVNCAEARAALGDTTVTTTSGRLGKLVSSGQAVVVRNGSQTRRYFATQAAADAWLSTLIPSRVALSADELRSIRIHAAKVRGAKASPPPLGARTKRVQPGRPGADMLVKGGTVSPPPPPMPKAASAPIFTDKTIRTIDDKQRPTARWQMQQEAPDDRWPSFAAARPGIDPSTGKAWEVRA